MIVTDSYVQGIADARALMRQFQSDGIADLATYRAALDTAQKAAKGASDSVRQYLGGECDFWRNQIKKVTT